LPLEAVIDQGIGDDREAAVLLGGEPTLDRATKDRPERPGGHVQAELVTQRALHVPHLQGPCRGDAQAFRNEGNEIIDPALLLGIPIDAKNREARKPGVAETTTCGSRRLSHAATLLAVHRRASLGRWTC